MIESRRSYRVSIALVLFLAVLPYLNSLNGEFVFDDIEVIQNNPAVTGSDASAVRLLNWVYKPGAWYRPLTMLTYLANHRLHASPVGYHVVNLCLHALVTVAVLHVARMLLGSLPAAAAAAALFAVHPVHVEAVTNITGRAELLAALLVLASLLSFIRAGEEHRSRRRLWVGFSLVTFASALLAKENSFTTIPLCVLIHLWLRRPASPRRAAVAVLPHVLVGLAYLMLRVLIVGALTLPEYGRPAMIDNPAAYATPAARLGTALVVLGDYLALLLVPLVLSADYSFNQVPLVLSFRDPSFLKALASLSVFGIAILVSIRRAPELGLAVCFTALALSLTANILFPIGTIKAERLLYLPSVGWCMGCGWTCLGAGRTRRPVGSFLLMLMVLGYAGRVWARNYDWWDNSGLWQATVNASPRSAKAHHNLGVVYLRQGLLEDASVHFRKALQIYPSYEESAFGLALVFHKKGNNAGALAWYEKTVRLQWNFSRAHYNTGIIFLRGGNSVGAEAAFRAALLGSPDNPLVLLGLANSLLLQGNAAEARLLIEQARPLIGKSSLVGDLLNGTLLALERRKPPFEAELSPAEHPETEPASFEARSSL